MRDYKGSSRLRVSLVFNHGRYYLFGPPGTKWLRCQVCRPWGFSLLATFFVVFLVVNEAFELRKDALVQAVTVF